MRGKRYATSKAFSAGDSRRTETISRINQSNEGATQVRGNAVTTTVVEIHLQLAKSSTDRN